MLEPLPGLYRPGDLEFKLPQLHGPLTTPCCPGTCCGFTAFYDRPVTCTQGLASFCMHASHAPYLQVCTTCPQCVLQEVLPISVFCILEYVPGFHRWNIPNLESEILQNLHCLEHHVSTYKTSSFPLGMLSLSFLFFALFCFLYFPPFVLTWFLLLCSHSSWSKMPISLAILEGSYWVLLSSKQSVHENPSIFPQETLIFVFSSQFLSVLL